MSRRERVLRCYEFNYPDRMPIMQAYYQGALIRYGQKLLDLLSRYPNDFGTNAYQSYELDIRDLDPNYHKLETDPWGCVWEYRYEGILGLPVHHPLADLDELKTYKPPEGSVPYGPEFERHRAEVESIKQELVYQWATPWLGGFCTFERMQWLRGYENLMIDFALDAPELETIADIVVETNLHEIEYGAALGADVLWFADDWGTQEQLMISPAKWRTFFKPRYKTMFDACHEGGMKVCFHSDGQILEIVPDLIEIGMDIFQPQFSCLDIRQMAEMTKGKVTVIMDLDRQHILPFGTPDEVRAHVKEVIEVFGLPEGGLVGKGEIMPDVPLENAEAMFEALLEYGSRIGSK